MTLTVRSASVTGATTAARALTHAEMDANWDHVANFTPSGGTKEPVVTALQRLPHSSQYSSTANFNAAQAALTGTLGANEIRVGTGEDVGLTLPSQLDAQNFAVLVGGTTFNGQFDPTLSWGYTSTVSGEPGLAYSMEAHYYDGANHWMEVNLSYIPDGGVSRRFDYQQIHRSSHTRSIYALASTEFQLITGDFTFSPGNYLLDITDQRMAVFGQTSDVSGLPGFAHIGIVGTWAQASDHYGIILTPTLTSALGAGRAFIGYKSAVNTSASALTLSNIYDFAANDGTLGATSAITNHYGFACGDLVNATNNYGFEGLVTSGSNKWNLHMSGTAQNFLQGVTGIGIAASSTAQLALAAGTTGVASLRIPHGSAPTSPVNGDMWTTTSGLFVRVNGATVGPLT